MKLLNISLIHVNRLSALLIYFCFLACLLPIAIFAYKHPSYNWDMLAYMALVVEIEKGDINEVHKITYDNARQNLPVSDYEKLISGDLRKNKIGKPFRI